MSEENYRNPSGKVTQEATLRDIVMPLFRRRRLLILTFCGILLGSIVAAIFLSSRYEAQMDILVNRDRMNPMVTTEQFSQTAPVAPLVTEEEINSEVQLLQSEDLLKQVVLANKLQDVERDSFWSKITPKKDEATYVAKAVERLGKKLKVDAVKKTNMIEVSYQSPDPQLAYGVLSALSTGYLQKHVAVHRPVGSYEFFAKETDKYQKALQDSEVRLADFGLTEGTAAPDVVRTDLAQQVAISIGTMHTAQQAAAADEQRIRDEEAQLKVTPARSATLEASNAADLLLQQLQANLLAAQVKRTQLAMKYDPSYPLVQEADQEIAQTQAAIKDAEKTQYLNQTTDRDPTYELLRADIAKTKADLASQKATAAAVASQHRLNESPTRRSGSEICETVGPDSRDQGQRSELPALPLQAGAREDFRRTRSKAHCECGDCCSAQRAGIAGLQRWPGLAHRILARHHCRRRCGFRCRVPGSLVPHA